MDDLIKQLDDFLNPNISDKALEAFLTIYNNPNMTKHQVRVKIAAVKAHKAFVKARKLDNEVNGYHKIVFD